MTLKLLQRVCSGASRFTRSPSRGGNCMRPQGGYSDKRECRSPRKRYIKVNAEDALASSEGAARMFFRPHPPAAVQAIYQAYIFKVSSFAVFPDIVRDTSTKIVLAPCPCPPCTSHIIGHTFLRFQVLQFF